MRTYQYLIVGGGLTADAACKGIRERDPDGAIGVVTDEAHPPYARPPLTKALWKGDGEDTIWCGTPELGVDLRLGRTIVSLDLPPSRRPTTRAKPTPTSGCCSQPVAGPAACRSAATR